MVVQHQKRVEYVRITRRVYIAGESVEPGAVVEVGEQFAAELVLAGKAERTAAPDPDAGAEASKDKPKTRGKAAPDA